MRRSSQQPDTSAWSNQHNPVSLHIPACQSHCSAHILRASDRRTLVTTIFLPPTAWPNWTKSPVFFLTHFHCFLNSSILRLKLGIPVPPCLTYSVDFADVLLLKGKPVVVPLGHLELAPAQVVCHVLLFPCYHSASLPTAANSRPVFSSSLFAVFPNAVGCFPT